MSKAAPKTCQVNQCVPYSYTHIRTVRETHAARTITQTHRRHHICTSKHTETNSSADFFNLINWEWQNFQTFFSPPYFSIKVAHSLPPLHTHTPTPTNVVPLREISSAWTHTNAHIWSHLFLRHAVQLRIPGGGVRAVIGGGRGEVLQYDWVSLLTQWGQVTDVQLQFAAILIEIQERRENLREDKKLDGFILFAHKTWQQKAAVQYSAWWVSKDFAGILS